MKLSKRFAGRVTTTHPRPAVGKRPKIYTLIEARKQRAVPSPDLQLLSAAIRRDAVSLLKFFVVCAPGLEGIVAEELGELGIRRGRIMRGGVEASGSTRDLYKANYLLRTGSRILLRLASFRAVTFPELSKAVSRIPWNNFISPDSTLEIRPSSHSSKLYHTGGISDVVGKAIKKIVPPAEDSAEVAEEENDEDELHSGRQKIVVRISNDTCEISIDTSGELLSRRGYRLQSAKAPLRESMAAAMVRASGWRSSETFIDPLCGSGTVAIEAALLATSRPAGELREFQFKRWPSFNRGAFVSVVGEAKARVGSGEGLKIFASDRDEGAIEAARANAERAGVASFIEFSVKPVSAISSDEEGVVITNPPYGMRVGEEKALRDLYAYVGQKLPSRIPAFKLFLLTGNPRLVAAAGAKFDCKHQFLHGGIRVGFYQLQREMS